MKDDLKLRTFTGLFFLIILLHSSLPSSCFALCNYNTTYILNENGSSKWFSCVILIMQLCSLSVLQNWDEQGCIFMPLMLLKSCLPHDSRSSIQDILTFSQKQQTPCNISAALLHSELLLLSSCDQRGEGNNSAILKIVLHLDKI